ncbi:hypothetical protein LMG19083_03010 [Ralstonia psammae]|uniref:Uncharacterized protein n=1 Tax=Ralstonia psammae TaxID=3058598 RepID=A0ABM9JM64_9RALS|nr:hypothetical protein LMG19083_03010 [Ralstonia sp. LMG 19083]
MTPACDDWMTRLWSLAACHANLGLIADLHVLTLIELWGVYCFLGGIDGGAI